MKTCSCICSAQSKNWKQFRDCLVQSGNSHFVEQSQNLYGTILELHKRFGYIQVDVKIKLSESYHDNTFWFKIYSLD